MLMTVDELRRFVSTEEDDQALEARLQALELLIRAYTNNNFQQRAFRAAADAVPGYNLLCDDPPALRAGDTLQITDSDFMPDFLVTVESVEGDVVTVREELYAETGITITKVVYPADVKLGAANMLKWQLDNGDKVGVSSETISRHSVTYFNMDGDNSTMGFPKAVTGFLRPYKRARFGRGVRT